MGGMADASYTAVDLSRLAASDAVEELDFETILADAVAKMREYMAESGLTFAARNSDPATKLLQAFSYFAQLMRQRINEAVRAVMVASATGNDLDNVAANFGVTRLTITPADEDTGTAAVMESDTDLRRRVVLAPEGYSVAGPEGAYIFHTLSADSDVLDATATSPSPGQVLVTVLSRTGNGAAPQAVLDTVEAYLSAATRRPLTDLVTVQSAEIVEYAVDYDLTAYSGPDRDVVFATSKAQVDAYVADSHRLGRDITIAALHRAALAEGAQNVLLRSPTADIPISRQQAPYCTGVTARFAGNGE